MKYGIIPILSILMCLNFLTGQTLAEGEGRTLNTGTNHHSQRRTLTSHPDWLARWADEGQDPPCSCSTACCACTIAPSGSIADTVFIFGESQTFQAPSYTASVTCLGESWTTRIECDLNFDGVYSPTDCPDLVAYNGSTGAIVLSSVTYEADPAAYALAIQEEGTYAMAIRTAASSDPFTASQVRFTVTAVDCYIEMVVPTLTIITVLGGPEVITA